MENTEAAILTIIIGYMKFKSHFFGLNKKESKMKERIVLDLVK